MVNKFKISSLKFSTNCASTKCSGSLFHSFTLEGKKECKYELTLDKVVANALADLFICRTFYCQMSEKSEFTKPSPPPTFPLSVFGLFSSNQFGESLKITMQINRMPLSSHLYCEHGLLSIQ